MICTMALPAPALPVLPAYPLRPNLGKINVYHSEGPRDKLTSSQSASIASIQSIQVSSAADDRMRQATVNLFADMGVQPASLQAGLTPGDAVHRHHGANFDYSISSRWCNHPDRFSGSHHRYGRRFRRGPGLGR